MALDARNGVVFCNGALHMPAPWRGERYALVFFTQVGLGKVSWEDLRAAAESLVPAVCRVACA